MQGEFCLEKEGIEIKSVWGGQEFVVTYSVSHVVNGVENLYSVTASLRGLNDFTPELDFKEVVTTSTNNSETVSCEVLIDELNSCNSSQLLGMESL